MNIVLIGFMGTGKSAAGRRLADQLRMSFIDLDQQIEAEAQQTIETLFKLEGEAGFRKREAQAVKRLGGLDNHVLATGGGAVLDPENLSQLKALGPLVCLTARPEVIQQRTQSNAADRPLLDGEASLDRIEALLQDRAPFYAQAEYTIDTSNQSHQQVVDAIIKQVDGLSADSERVS